jgi:hypothetical protein
MLRVICSRLFVAAGLLLVGTAALADDAPQAPPATRQALTPKPVRSASFLNRVLVPRIDARLRGESTAALDFVPARTDILANPWTRDARAVQRVQADAIYATKDAMKRYVVDQLGLNAWSVPLGGGSGHGIDAMRTESGGTRLRFGISHMAPRAELMIPSGNSGRVTLGLDGRGRMSAGFETASARVRIGGSFDPSSHDLNVVFSTRF